MLNTLIQTLALLATLASNDGRDRCAQLDTLSPGETMPDAIGLKVCGTGTTLDGTVYTGWEVK